MAVELFQISVLAAVLTIMMICSNNLTVHLPVQMAMQSMEMDMELSVYLYLLSDDGNAFLNK
jgi:hypothetical protein